MNSQQRITKGTSPIGTAATEFTGMNILKKTAFATALAATALTSATPAMARDHYNRGGDRTGTAIAVGVAGLALGAIIASSSNRHDRYRDDRYYDRNVRYYDGYNGYNGYDRSYDYYRDGRGYDRGGRYYDRRGYRGF
jgi:hypothetical protein